MAAHVAKTWPSAPNPSTFFLLVLSAFPSARRERGEACASELRSVLLFAILSVWFFSSVQKLAQVNS